MPRAMEQDAGGVLASVVDVYDLASEIGKEFEKLIDAHGADSLTNMMPKVISALEQLERLAMKNEREDSTLQDLRAKIALLESDKQEKAQDRCKFEKELEQIEEHWRSESRDLVALVAKLQEENRRLAGQLKEEPPPPSASPDGNQMEASFMGQLRDTADVLREQNRSKDRDLKAQKHDIDNLQSQLERSTAVARELRRKQKTYQTQVRSLLEERSDFLAQLQEQAREVMSLRQLLGLAQKENQDLTEGLPGVLNGSAQIQTLLAEKSRLEVQVKQLEAQLAAATAAPEPVAEPGPSDDGEDAPVQGPLPYEPDDVPWKRAGESGIRKFFRKLFGEANHLASPKRSLSALSKLTLSSDPLA
ncbi:RILP-like protein homolog [Neocloeon triangulifer]|uniref:RILP-like protein homolog n=1 Tax=Neocloeon triangulifer TaxID=2078957 RepID=UPI00286F1354|nr:RILP-like protein homolog [Neocloeon triangulifer]